MASIKDALEESVQDSTAWIKYVLYTIPSFFIASAIVGGKDLSGITLWIILTLILYFGFMLNCTYNVRMGNNVVLPSFNVFAVFWMGVKGCIALAPLGLLGYFISSALIGYIKNIFPESGILSFFNYAIIAICTSFVLTGYLLYIKKFKIFDAYNVKLIFKYCVDVMIASLVMFLLVAIVDAVILAPLTYILWLFMGIPNPVAIFIWCTIGLLNIAMIGHYLAQIDYEIIPVNKDEEDVITKTVNDVVKK